MPINYVILEGIPGKELSPIRQAVQRGQLTGNNRFIDEVENILDRRVEFRTQARPMQGNSR